MSNTPNPRKRTTTRAQKAEATASTISFEFRGKTYTADPLELTWDLLQRDATGDYAAVMVALLGEKQWAVFTKANPKPLELDDDGDIVSVSGLLRNAMFEALGNQSASSDS